MNRQKIEQRIEELKGKLPDDRKRPSDDPDLKQTLRIRMQLQIEFLQTLLDEPLDAPTHDGWWFHSEHPTSLFLVEKDIIQEIFISGGCDFKHIKEIKNWSGKWLPANNPFGKGEG